MLEISESQRTDQLLHLQSAALEAADNSIVIADENGRIIWVNAGFSRTTGYSLAEAVGQNPRMLKSGEQDSAYYEEMWATILAGKVWRNRIVNRCKDGRLTHEDLTITPILDAAGRVTHFIGIKQDITQLTRAEDALGESELRLHAVIENLSEGLVVSDLNGRLLHWNQAALEMHGFATPEECRKKLLEFGSIFELSDVDGAVLELDQWPLSRIMRGERLRDFEVRIRRRTGDWHRVFSYGGRVIREQSGRSVAIVTMSDITDRTRSGEAHRASELRYRRLFESAKDGILILDEATGRIVDANPFILSSLGYSYEELRGKELWEIGFFPDVHQAARAFAELRATGYVRYADLPLETRGGESIEVEVVANVYLEGDSKVIQCNIRDITGRMFSERALEESNRKLGATVAELSTTTEQLWQSSKLATMGELSASIAHELNNPLATISLRVENLLMPMTADDPKRHSLEIIGQEVDRMARLVDNLLEFSRRGHRQISTVDVIDEISKSIDFVHYHLRTRKVDVEREFEELLPTIQADRQRLRQLFLNLLTNASDAMPRGGTLIVRIRRGVLGESEAVEIEFADTGEGITPEHLKQIWEPFFTTKEAGKGTGLGLAICRRIVDEHGGRIEIASTIGQGTIVRVSFPATTKGVRTDLE
jgi:PAS domain S-box-containing protein